MIEALPDGALALAAAFAAGAVGLLASAHAVLNKRRPRAAFGWIAVCLTFPLAGALLYFVFGINRTRRRALKLREHEPIPGTGGTTPAALTPASEPLDMLGQTLSGFPLIGGNSVTPLHNGEEAYPAMLEAMAGAERRLYLSTYIFDSDEVGRDFAEALQRAVQRGVDVRVLVDGVGELYSFPPVRRLLRRRGVPVQRFLPPRLIPPSFRINLRNHRKILVVDDRVAFVGGMNIGARHLAARQDNPKRVVDLHFRLRGPIVAALRHAFEHDWLFAGGPEPEERAASEDAAGEDAAGAPAAAADAGAALCRPIIDGPDEPVDRLLLLLVGAIGLARHRVAIMTPYFVPPRELLGALQAAALRGLDVAIVLPENNNLFFAHRATRHLLWELLERGVRIYYQPGPFVHSKLLLVDDHYVQIGSANLDPRSLRLNFELTVEVYDRSLATALHQHFTAVRARSTEVRLQDVDGRPLRRRLLDGLAWLFSPYL